MHCPKREQIITITTRLQGSNGSPDGSVASAVKTKPGNLDMNASATNESYQSASLTSPPSGQSVDRCSYLLCISSQTSHRYQAGNDDRPQYGGVCAPTGLCRNPSLFSVYDSLSCLFIVCLCIIATLLNLIRHGPSVNLGINNRDNHRSCTSWASAEAIHRWSMWSTRIRPRCPHGGHRHLCVPASAARFPDRT